MKATGIVRRIDDLGRVVIPKEIRRTLKIRECGASGDFYGSEWGDYSEEIFADRGVFERGAAAGGCGGENVRKVVLYL